VSKNAGYVDRNARPVQVPVWGWLLLILVLLLLFAVLYDNGALLTPLVGESAYSQNYLHEFFHDGRHLLGVPGH
jgi:hypothetical protein